MSSGLFTDTNFFAQFKEQRGIINKPSSLYLGIVCSKKNPQVSYFIKAVHETEKIKFEMLLNEVKVLEKIRTMYLGKDNVFRAKHLCDYKGSSKELKNGWKYISIQYYTDDFQNWIDSKIELTTNDALWFLKQMIDSLDEMYEIDKNFIHADLKPKNFMYNLENNLPSVKLIDFETSQFSLLITNVTSKNINYDSPERMLEQSFDQKSDVYSLGVILFRMLCKDSEEFVTSIQKFTSRANHKENLSDYLSNERKQTLPMAVKVLLDSMTKYDQKERFSMEGVIDYLSEKIKLVIPDPASFKDKPQSPVSHQKLDLGDGKARGIMVSLDEGSFGSKKASKFMNGDDENMNIKNNMEFGTDSFAGMQGGDGAAMLERLLEKSSIDIQNNHENESPDSTFQNNGQKLDDITVKMKQEFSVPVNKQDRIVPGSEEEKPIKEPTTNFHKKKAINVINDSPLTNTPTNKVNPSGQSPPRTFVSPTKPPPKREKPDLNLKNFLESMCRGSLLLDAAKRLFLASLYPAMDEESTKKILLASSEFVNEALAENELQVSHVEEFENLKNLGGKVDSVRKEIKKLADRVRDRIEILTLEGHSNDVDIKKKILGDLATIIEHNESDLNLQTKCMEAYNFVFLCNFFEKEIASISFQEVKEKIFAVSNPKTTKAIFMHLSHKVANEQKSHEYPTLTHQDRTMDKHSPQPPSRFKPSSPN